jgi:hypothetical protein
MGRRVARVWENVRWGWGLLLCAWFHHHCFVETKLTKRTSNHICKYCGEGYGTTTFGPVHIMISSEPLQKDE